MCSLVNSCVWMRVCRHRCDITRILIGHALSNVCFDWLVRHMSTCQENFFDQELNKQNSPSLVELFSRNIL